MLTQEAINRLAALAKIKAEDLKAAIDATEEKAVDIDASVVAFNETELSTLKANEYNRGKVTGPEMLIKEAKEKLGLDFTGKTIDNLLDAYSKKVLADAKIEPEKKVKDLEEKLSTAQATANDFKTKLEQKEQEVSKIKDMTEIAKFIPAFGDNAPALGHDEVITLMQANGYNYQRNDTGKLVFMKDGKELTDNLGNAVDPSVAITGFLKEKKLIVDVPAPGGRGGGNGTPPASFTKLSELKKHFTDQGKSLMGQEFMAEVEKARAANADFKLDA